MTEAEYYRDYGPRIGTIAVDIEDLGKQTAYYAVEFTPHSYEDRLQERVLFDGIEWPDRSTQIAALEEQNQVASSLVGELRHQTAEHLGHDRAALSELPFDRAVHLDGLVNHPDERGDTSFAVTKLEGVERVGESATYIAKASDEGLVTCQVTDILRLGSKVVKAGVRIEPYRDELVGACMALSQALPEADDTFDRLLNGHFESSVALEGMLEGVTVVYGDLLRPRELKRLVKEVRKRAVLVKEAREAFPDEPPTTNQLDSVEAHLGYLKDVIKLESL